MMDLTRPLAVLAVCAALVLPRLATAQATTAIPAANTTPNRVETRIGTLDFKEGMPSKETIDKVYDNLDLTHALNAFVNTYQAVNMAAGHNGFLSVGVKDNEIACRTSNQITRSSPSVSSCCVSMMSRSAPHSTVIGFAAAISYLLRNAITK